MFISPLVLAAIAPLQLLVHPVLADAISSSVVPTKNYISTISGYDDLSTCAENVLSTIVQAQSSGCGDDGALTSYTCFCTDSSSRFSSDITSAVSVTCDSAIASEQASSAIQVFDAYCALGVKAGLATTTTPSTASATGTASPAASASSTAAIATATPSAGAKTTAKTTTTTRTTGSASAQGTAVVNSAIIAAAVIVPVCAIALGLMWCFLWRRRRRHTRSDRTEKQRELEDMPSREAPPRRLETMRATTEFKWPARMGDASSRLTLQEVQYIQPPPQQHHPHHQQQIQQQQHHTLHQPQQPQQQYPQHYQQHQQHQNSQKHLHPRGADAPEKELFVNSPTAASFLSSTGTTLPPHYNPEYHISPQAYAQQDNNSSIHSSQTHEDLLKHKYPAQGLHQTEPAELPHHDLPELYQHEQEQQPQELPAAAVAAPAMFPQELDGSVSLASPPPPRSRFSYQR